MILGAGEAFDASFRFTVRAIHTILQMKNV